MTRSTAQIANDAQRYIKMTRSVTQCAIAHSDVCREELDERSVAALISFFEVLSKWDREARHNAAEIM